MPLELHIFMALPGNKCFRCLIGNTFLRRDCGLRECFKCGALMTPYQEKTNTEEINDKSKSNS